MSIILYDLCGANDVRFSPYCWRAKLALAHKGLDYETRATSFTAISKILDGGEKTVPVMSDGDTVVRGSFEIAEYLEQHYPDRPALFSGAAGRQFARFMYHWTAGLHKDMATMVIKDIHDALLAEDQTYFRTSREKVFGDTLENIQAEREAARNRFRSNVQPLESLLREQSYLAGDQPQYADYVVFGSLQWVTVISGYAAISQSDSPLRAWFERCASLFNGLGVKAKRAA